MIDRFCYRYKLHIKKNAMFGESTNRGTFWNVPAVILITVKLPFPHETFSPEPSLLCALQRRTFIYFLKFNNLTPGKCSRTKQVAELFDTLTKTDNKRGVPIKKKDFANFETAHRSQNFPERYNIQLIIVIKTDI